jgi:microcystin-dependent protein
MATQNKGLLTPAFNSTSWDVPLNNNFGYLDAAFGNTATVSNSSAYTLATAEYQCMRLRFNGTLSNNVTISFPSGVGGMWIITNATTDASAAAPRYLTLNTTAGGSVGVTPPRGSTVTVFSDGTDVVYAFPFPLPGEIMEYAGTSAPAGYLPCDGAPVSRSTYSALFAAISTTWGVGNGTTTFNVPDLRGVFLRGSGTNTTGSSSGATGPAVGFYVADTYQSHTHSASQAAHSHTYRATTGNSGAYAGGVFGAIGSLNSPTETTNTATPAITVSASGGTETSPKTYGVLMCIKT